MCTINITIIVIMTIFNKRNKNNDNNNKAFICILTSHIVCMKTLAQAQMCKNIPVVQGQPTRQKTTYATEINKQSNGVNTCLGTIATDQFDP